MLYVEFLYVSLLLTQPSFNKDNTTSDKPPSKRSLRQYVCANPQPGHPGASTCFKSWELLEDSSFWRPIQFGESGGVIAAMEPHHHS